MNISKLIEELQGYASIYGDDVEVRIGSDYGDRCHTHQALHLKTVEMVSLEKTSYSDSGEAVRKEYEDGEDAGPQVLILSALHLH